MSEYDRNMFFSKDENDALDHLTKTYPVVIPDEISAGRGDFSEADPFYDEEVVIDQLHEKELAPESLKELLKIERRIRLQRNKYAMTGKYDVFGPEGTMGYFLRTKLFDYAGE